VSRPNNRMHEYKSFEHLGKKCENNSECRKGASCLYGVCACPPHTVANQSEFCIPETVKPSLLQRFQVPQMSLNDSNGEYPGNKCGEDRACRMGSICKAVVGTTPHCVCDVRMVVSSSGVCTTKLLAKTKKSKKTLISSSCLFRTPRLSLY
jgi:hypothetical protein